MASEEDRITIYNEDDDDEPLNDVVLDDGEDLVLGDRDADDSSDSDTNSTSSAAIRAVPLSSSSVSIAVLPPSSSVSINGSDLRPPVTPALSAAAATAVVVMSSPNAAATTTPVSERKPVEDSRKLFQRLWTDEDEIEILQGFLEYNTQRGPNLSGYHHDTTAFYDQIKSRLQYDCNKNQLVEKLRRLKKKYRNVVSRMTSGKEVVFKTPHDQATFEISRKIWSNSTSQRPEFDEDDQNPNPITGSGTPVIPTFHGIGDMRTPRGFGIDINSSDKALALMNMGTPDRSRKRSKVNMEEKISRNGSSGGYEAPASATVAPVQFSVEETVKNSLSPLLKEFIDKFAVGRSTGDGGGRVSKGIESLMSNTIPMNFPGPSSTSYGDFMEERWRKQQILELEVYSKRLELVQDQIKEMVYLSRLIVQPVHSGPDRSL
ncbi:hypothetical protein V2J09_007906 [Rumex salicifolius]